MKLSDMDHALYVVQTPPEDNDDGPLNPEYTYKLSEAELVKFVRLRAANDVLFTGKRNTSVIAWRAILKEMGIQRKMSTSQARKKWENLKKKYKEMKNPPPGVTVNPTNWQWFSLMDDAMEGRLNDSEAIVSTSSLGDDHEYRPDKPRKRGRDSYRSEIDFLIEGDESRLSGDTSRGRGDMGSDGDEMEQERALLDSDRAALESERMVLEREKMVLDRERAGLERELAALDRDRASLEREKAAVERDRAAVEHARAQLEKERAEMDKERAKLERNRGALERQRGGDLYDSLGESEKSAEAEMEVASIERRQKFLDLFEKLIETF
ncbi:caldesmon [Hoplias malabaricus]|uniref:caldesmon n=1 Tax=Hoplias malabaricus TaxID=27720 RepID=UPI003461B970